MNLPPMYPARGDSVGLSELSATCALSLADLQELMDYGALAPLTDLGALAPLTDPGALAPQPEPTEPLFAISYIEPLRLASTARRDYDLDLFVVVILMDYLHRIAALESQLDRLKAQSLFRC